MSASRFNLSQHRVVALMCAGATLGAAGRSVGVQRTPPESGSPWPLATTRSNKPANSKS